MEPSGVADGGVSPRDQLRHAGLSHGGTAITAIALARLDDPTPASSPTMGSPSSLSPLVYLRSGPAHIAIGTNCNDAVGSGG